jgi:hypothetical protein
MELVPGVTVSSSSPRSRSPSTTPSDSHSSRNCGRACSPSTFARRRTSGRRASKRPWVALLRYLGCTGHAHEVAVVFGDEIAIRGADARARRREPRGSARRFDAFATASLSPEQTAQVAQNFRGACMLGGAHIVDDVLLVVADVDASRALYTVE